MAGQQQSPGSGPGEYRMFNLQYAQTLSLGPQRPLISNQNMGELIARNHKFKKGFEPKVAHNHTPSDEKESIKHFVAAPDGLSTTGSIYSSLYQEGEFRLLAILPGTDDTPIRCRLHVCSLGDNHDTYEALSYCWRAESESDWSVEYPTIECNGVEMPIGVNLHLALRRIRRPGSTRVVWADAICIDQSNLVERSQQVAAMGDIFRNAFRVLVWLGPDGDDDPLKSTASQALVSVCSIVSTWATPTDRPVNVENARYRIQGLAQDFHGEGPLSQDSPVWLQALALYKTRWFQRLWVVQEIALAQRATVIWGKCEMSWQWIGLAAAVIRTNWHRIVPNHSNRSGVSDRQVPIGVMNAYFMYRISRSQDYLKPLLFSFCELLTLTRQFGCQEKRDKIFGLLGLATTDGVNSLIAPDYTNSLGEVYRNLARLMISSKNPLAILSHIHHTEIFDHPGHDVYAYDHDYSPQAGSARVTPFKDSWIPRWDVKGPQTLTPLDAHPDFAAGLSQPAQIRDGVQGDRLTVRGIIIDGVKHKLWMNTQYFKQQQSFAWEQTPGLREILERGGHTRHSLERLALTLTAGKSWYDDKETRSGNNSGNQDDTAGLSPAGEFITMSELEELATEGNGPLFLDAVTTACVGRCLFSTGSHMGGVGPLDTRPGDMVCIIYGAAVPFVIRPYEDKQWYTLVGECYVQHLMHGGVIGDERYKGTWIELV
ncbi:uncharacterized protein NECHADRAFT_87764 [Fusarium vanettenii 77-13-4]|uniref:Heterokaryon incompatibility domain-containing protein n=1 Tax=Fusarium vanettenii (strain ATCC MYA-4622 / CBS 123669 / FGSC 9596 / NRRL 45880 / 77-13-4) TaxID=660122 RepID=C7Z2Y9_FUSV7|nr:uncharacterized protein NECHADRAFT_87764 [Fusarium vanettenii 77-13-4]EEU41739.1 hypothetical protein NECHADRAFT_87764 [Fusarium vanettenii 77-13-4]